MKANLKDVSIEMSFEKFIELRSEIFKMAKLSGVSNEYLAHYLKTRYPNIDEFTTAISKINNF